MSASNASVLEPPHAAALSQPTSSSLLNHHHLPLRKGMSSSDARYRAIPQAPLPSQPLGFPDEEDESTLTDRGLGAPNVPSGAILAVNFALGAAVLLPWNVLITATPYFVSRLVASPFQTSFNSYMSCSFTAANCESHMDRCSGLLS